MPIRDPRRSNAPPFLQRYGILLLTGVGLLLADQISKLWILYGSGFTHGLYPPYGGRVVIPGFFNLVYATNYGAAWGVLSGHVHWLIVFACIALGAILYFRHALELRQPLHQVCFGLITGGIVGNTIDRLWHGRVIDFFDFDLWIYRWPTFNFADCGIVVGTLLYLALSLRAR